MRQKKGATKVAKESVKNLSVTESNFSEIRETLKSGAKVQVNETVTLTSWLPNTETTNASGKITRTPFYYVSADGTKLTSTTLKKLLNLQPEKKGQREETTFAKVSLPKSYKIPFFTRYRNGFFAKHSFIFPKRKPQCMHCGFHQ